MVPVDMTINALIVSAWEVANKPRYYFCIDREELSIKLGSFRTRDTALEASFVTDSNKVIQFNSIQFFIIYVPSQQPQGQLQTQHSTDIHNNNSNNNNNNNNNKQNQSAIMKKYDSSSYANHYIW
jgi:hypothetical protein